MNNVLWGMERKEITAVIILDMSAAFDIIDHDLLLVILQNRYSITDMALQWYKSYLRPWCMRMCINYAYSSIMALNYSVPQGSVSGANLVAAFYAPIESVIPAGITISGFTEDHLIRKSFIANSRDQEDQTISMLMDTVATIASWMDTMHLKLNPDKTEFIMFSYKSQLVKCATDSVSISDRAIPRSPSVKYLGVTLDENLSLKEHIILKHRKAVANFVMICKICKFLTKDAHTTLVLGLCISHFDYANALFYGLLKKTILHLQRIQAMCAKLTIDKSMFDSTTKALAHLHWLPIR